MTLEEVKELAALHLAGGLENQDAAELQKASANRDPKVLRELAAFSNLAAILAQANGSTQKPSAGLKSRIFAEIEKRKAAPPSTPAPMGLTAGLKIIRQNESAPWQPLPVPGAFVKLLSIDHARGYAVALGKLEPGAHYPRHKHLASEQVFVLSGDLHIGSERLEAGDFHHADAGSTHDVNYSETGCVVLVVLSIADLQAQYAST